MEIAQYTIVLVNLAPTIGAEMQKTRPCVVISPIELNRNITTVVVAPITTNLTTYPSRAPITHNDKKGMIALEQIKTIDKRRIKKQLGELTNQEIKRCKNILKEMYVD